MNEYSNEEIDYLKSYIIDAINQSNIELNTKIFINRKDSVISLSFIEAFKIVYQNIVDSNEELTLDGIKYSKLAYYLLINNYQKNDLIKYLIDNKYDLLSEVSIGNHKYSLITFLFEINFFNSEKDYLEFIDYCKENYQLDLSINKVNNNLLSNNKIYNYYGYLIDNDKLELDISKNIIFYVDDNCYDSLGYIMTHNSSLLKIPFDYLKEHIKSLKETKVIINDETNLLDYYCSDIDNINCFVNQNLIKILCLATTSELNSLFTHMNISRIYYLFQSIKDYNENNKEEYLKILKSISDRIDQEENVKSQDKNSKLPMGIKKSLDSIFETLLLNAEEFYDNLEEEIPKWLSIFRKYGINTNRESILYAINLLDFNTYTEQIDSNSTDGMSFGTSNLIYISLKNYSDIFQIMALIFHELIHHYSNYIIKDGFNSGLIGDTNSGFNEVVTEYIVKQLYPESKCYYDAGVYCLDKLIDAGVFEKEKLIDAYFRHDVSYIYQSFAIYKLNKDIKNSNIDETLINIIKKNIRNKNYEFNANSYVDNYLKECYQQCQSLLAKFSCIANCFPKDKREEKIEKLYNDIDEIVQNSDYTI